MRRWNGWGNEKTDYPLPSSAGEYLMEQIGPAERLPPDAALDEVLERLPAPRLAPDDLITTEPFERLRHARGQSLPDWVDLRHGRVETPPDGVAFPRSAEQVRRLIGFAARHGARLIPYGGGTSVVGHINPAASAAPSLTVDLGRLNRLVGLDEISLLATFEAGIAGPEIEAVLNERGFTLGHFPQSFELSTLGGWVATRSSGQQSYYYGRIEDLFAGGRLETGAGPLEFPPLPASAAGPDLRHLALGSEGRYGVLTHAVVRIRRLPEREAFYGIFFHTWEDGLEALREIAQKRIPISMARLSNAVETETTLRLSGKEGLVRWAKAGLGFLGYAQKRALLILGVTGDASAVRYAKRAALHTVRRYNGFYSGAPIGALWRKSRFLSPYLRNHLWEAGYAVDTLETALPWSSLPPAAGRVPEAIAEALEAFGERGLVFAHLSHIYRDGASLYVTCLFRRSADPEATLARWRGMKEAASRAIVELGGTISHQHGVGRDHAPYLTSEKGEIGMRLLRGAAQTLDPEGVFNPGVLFD